MSTIRKQFILTINSFKDINFNHSDIKFLQQLKCNGIKVDSKVFDGLCENTIDYCYDAIRASGELLQTKTLNNLSSLIGDYLFKILLKNKIGDELIKSINVNDEKEENEKEDLQLILKFGDSSDASKLAKCPWEYLHYSNEIDPGKGYFLISKIKLHRVYDKPSAGIETLKELKVLFFFSPIKGQFEKKDIIEVEEILKDLSDRSNFSYVYSAAPDSDYDADIKTTYDNFYLAIKRYRPDIIHFIGEAQIQTDEGQLYFWQKNTDTTDLKKQFYPDFKRVITSLGIKLFIFQTWNNFFGDSAYLAFKNIAERLIEYKLPAVLSIPYSFNLKDPQNLAIYKRNISEFYESLLKGLSLSDAISALGNSLSRAGKGYPITYLGSQDIDLFKIQQKTPGDGSIDEDKGNQPTLKQSGGALSSNLETKLVQPIVKTSQSDSFNVLSDPDTKITMLSPGNEADINLSKDRIKNSLSRLVETEKKLSADNSVRLDQDKRIMKTHEDIIVKALEMLRNLKEGLGMEQFKDSTNNIINEITARIDALLDERKNKQDEKIANDEDPSEVVEFLDNKILLYRTFNERINKAVDG